ncbi:MAG: hypothetical protein KIS68_06755 [Bauldia sp.]|nr:hypothetical protein [Bauldia sp.]
MRRLTAVALVVGSSLGLAACGGGTPQEAASEPTATSSATLDQRLATIAAAQADLVTIIQQRTDSSAQVLTAIADLNTRLDTLQREVDAFVADTAATTTRTSTALSDISAGLRDVRGAVDAMSRSLPASNTLSALATNLNSLGTNVATLIAGINAVAADIDGLVPRIDAVAAMQAQQAPLLAAAAAGEPAIADLTAAFVAYRDQAQGNGQLNPQQQQAIAVSLAALNAQLAAIGFPMDEVPAAVAATTSGAPGGTTGQGQAAGAASPATGAASPAPVRAGAFAAAPTTTASGASAGTALPDGRMLIETAINAANLTMSDRSFDLVTGTTYLWRITAGNSYAMRLLLPRFTDFAHVASVTVDGVIFEFPPLAEVDILEESVIEIEFTPIRTRVGTFEFLPLFGTTFTDMNMVGTMTFR